MITFKAIVIPGNRRKDGTYPVNIRVTFKGKSRRLATTLVCTPADLTRTLKIKNATILNRADALIVRMREAVNDISPFDLESEDVDWVVQHIKGVLSKADFHLDFFEWADKIIATKRPATGATYRTAVNAFARFLGRDEIDINEITHPLLMAFKESQDNGRRMYFNHWSGEFTETEYDRIPRNASNIFIGKLAHTFQAAKDRYNDEDGGRILIPRSPFSKIPKDQPVHQGEESIGLDTMQRVIAYQAEDPRMRTALDICIVSFGLMAVNIADLYDARPVEVEWVYNRRKTERRRADRAEMRVLVPEQIRPYLDRLRGEGEWWLNNLRQFSTDKDGVVARVDRWLKKWCDLNGVKHFTYYAFRHTWASLCRNECKVDKGTIADCMCHRGLFNTTDIYAEKAWGLMNEANQKVLDLFKW